MEHETTIETIFEKCLRLQKELQKELEVYDVVNGQILFANRNIRKIIEKLKSAGLSYEVIVKDVINPLLIREGLSPITIEAFYQYQFRWRKRKGKKGAKND